MEKGGEGGKVRELVAGVAEVGRWGCGAGVRRRRQDTCALFMLVARACVQLYP